MGVSGAVTGVANGSLKRRRSTRAIFENFPSYAALVNRRLLVPQAETGMVVIERHLLFQLMAESIESVAEGRSLGPSP